MLFTLLVSWCIRLSLSARELLLVFVYSDHLYKFSFLIRSERYPYYGVSFRSSLFSLLQVTMEIAVEDENKSPRKR